MTITRPWTANRLEGTGRRDLGSATRDQERLGMSGILAPGQPPVPRSITRNLNGYREGCRITRKANPHENLTRMTVDKMLVQHIYLALTLIRWEGCGCRA